MAGPALATAGAGQHVEAESASGRTGRIRAVVAATVRAGGIGVFATAKAFHWHLDRLARILYTIAGKAVRDGDLHVSAKDKRRN